MPNVKQCAILYVSHSDADDKVIVTGECRGSFWTYTIKQRVHEI